MTLNEWYDKHISLSSMDRFLIKEHINTFKYKPKISIVTPVYNTNKEWFEECAASVNIQLYDNWEWCVCDNGSEQELAKYVKGMNDYRVKSVRLEKNAGIAEGTNRALQLVTGDYVCFLDSDDKLVEQSLYLIVEAINKNKDVKFLYTDELLIDSNNSCINSFFKPDWSPYFLRSQCYINHLSTYKIDVLKKLGIKDCAGSQDYDLLLRVTENLTKSEIEHIPTVGYLWRTHFKSSSTLNESMAINGAVNSLKNHLDRKKIKGHVFIDWPWYRVKYDLDTWPDVGILICSINKNDILIKCINDILSHTDYPKYRIYLCITSNLREVIYNKYRNLVDLDIIRFVDRDEGEEYNYSLFANRLVNSCSESMICLMNDDIEPITDYWLKEMVGIAAQSDVGVVGAKLLYPNMTIQHAGAVLGIGDSCAHVFKHQHYTCIGYHGRAKLIGNFSVVTGACSLIRKEIYQEIGGYPEEQAVAFNDVDFCIRLIKKGYYNVYNPYAVMIHYESATRGLDTTPTQKALFVKEDAWLKNRWKDVLQKDSYYNPNLSLGDINFAVSDETRYNKPWLK